MSNTLSLSGVPAPAAVTPLGRDFFGTAKTRMQSFHATVPAGTSKETLEDPKFWSFVASSIQFGAICEIMDEAAAMYAKVIFIRSDGINTVVPRVLYMIPLAPITTPEAAARYVTGQRADKGWCVIEVETDRIVKDRLPNKATAEKELADLLRAQAR